MLVTANQISEELRKLMPNARFAATEAEIAEMAKNVVGTGLGQSTLQKGDSVTEVIGMTVVETKITGNPEPIKYIGLVVNCTTADGKNRQKITSFSGLHHTIREACPAWSCDTFVALRHWPKSCISPEPPSGCISSSPLCPEPSRSWKTNWGSAFLIGTGVELG